MATAYMTLPQEAAGARAARRARHPLFGEPALNWAAARRTLQPRYLIVWRDIAFRHAMLLGALVLHAALDLFFGDATALACAPVIALWTGLWLVSLNNFAHEAAHFNLARNRVSNDRLANWLVMAPFGMDAQRYRKVHWSHHLHLGGEADTETSYRNQPSLSFLLLCLTGLYPLRVLQRHASAGKPRTTNAHARTRSRQIVALARALGWHAVVLGTLAWLGAWPVAIAWIAGVVTVFPTFAALRQILEHRLDLATSEANAGDESDATNRLFGDGWWSRILGSAGFNRHLLHHWDPAISYTRLADMERMIEAAKGPEYLAPYRTTYLRTLGLLLRGNCDRPSNDADASQRRMAA